MNSWFKTVFGWTIVPAALIFSFGFASTAAAQGTAPAGGKSAADSTRTYLIEEIVISREAEPSVSETTLNEQTIHSQNVTSVADALSRVPGAAVSVGYKNSSEIMIRGFSSDEVLIMKDGRPMSEPYYDKIDLSTIGIGNISKIRVEKGSSSVRYGPNAMGGAVNILTTGADEGAPLSFNINGASGRDITADFAFRGSVSRLDYRIYAGRNVTRGFPLSSDFKPTSLENGGIRDNSDSRRTDLGLKLQWGPRNGSPWSIDLEQSHNVKGLPTDIYTARWWRFVNWNRYSVDIDGQPYVGAKFQVKTKLYVEKFLNELIDYKDGSYNDDNIFFDSTFDNYSAGFLLSSSYAHSESRTTNAGFQVRWEASNRQDNPGLKWLKNRIATNWLFIEHQYQFSPSLLVRGGISGYLFLYDSWKRSSTSFDPSLDVSWNVRDYLLSVSASHASRFPTLSQLFSSTSGNVNLKAEYSYKGEIGVSHTCLDVLDLSVTGFTNRIHDMIDRSGHLGIYHNVDRANIDGMELGGVLNLRRDTLYSTLTLLDAHDGDGIKLENRAPWKVDTGLTFQLFRNAEVMVTSQAVGKRWTQQFHQYLDAYHVENIQVSLWRNSPISMTMGVNNILDYNYTEEYAFPNPGRMFWAGMNWNWSGTPAMRSSDE